MESKNKSENRSADWAKNRSQTKPASSYESDEDLPVSDQKADPGDHAVQKKGKGLSLLLAAVPVLFALFLSLIAYFAGMFLSLFNEKIGTGTPVKELTVSDEGWVYLVKYLLFTIFFGLWYWHLIQKREKEMFLRRHTEKRPKPKNSRAPQTTWNPVTYWAARLPLLLVLGYALQLCVSSIIAILSNGFPDIFSAYKELIQSLAGTGIDWKTFIAVSFLAPIAEEIMFRGVSYHYARQALPAKWAILFQAVIFGIYHGNVVQFVYATVIGLLLGTLRRQAGSVVPGIVLHTIINLCAYLVPAAWIETVPKASLMFAVTLIIIIPCCIILLKRPKKKRNAEAKQKN